MKKSHISASKKALAIFTISVLVLSVFSILPFSQASAQSDEGTTTVSDDGGAPTLADQSALPSTVDPSTDDSTSSVSDSNSQTDNSQTDNSTSTDSSTTTTTTTDSTSAVTPTPNYPYPCPDFDNDGVVTQNDVNIAKANAGMDNPVFDDGDANLDGYVNAADTILTKSQLGRVCQSPDVTVTLIKYMDGVEATPANANSTSFPMTSTWTAANLNGGVQSSGTFSLSPTGFNTDQAYQAVTSEMSSGADYSAVENIPTDCDGNPYSLQGYKMGDSEADALNSPTVQTASFTNITQNEYILVMNHDCSTDPAPETSSITGIKFNDENGNGVQDQGELGIPNWTINLYSLGENDTPSFVESTNTDDNGNYSFDNLALGNYVVCEVAKNNWNETFPNPLVSPTTNNYDCSFDSTLGPIGHEIQLLNSKIETITTEGADNGDFGNEAAPCMVDDPQNVVSDDSTIVDSHPAVVFDSSNPSHTPNPGWTSVPGGSWISSDPLNEAGSSPTDVTKTYTRAFTISDTPTDSSLEIAADNSYTVNVNGHDIDTGSSATTIDNFSAPQTWTIPAADLQTGENTITFTVTNPSTDPNGNPYGDPNPSGLDYNLTVNSQNCGGENPPSDSTISGYKFNDLNGDGSWNHDQEPGIDGWTINLYSGDEGHQFIDSVDTNEDGSYSFEGLPAGTYYICEEHPGGWTQTDPSVDQTGGFCDGSNGYSVIVDGNNSQTDIDFGNEQNEEVPNGTITVEKQVVASDGTTPVTDNTSFQVCLDGGTCQPISESTGTTFTNVSPGEHTITETSQSGYTLKSYSSDNNSDPSDGAQLTVNSDSNTDLVVTNAQVAVTPPPSGGGGGVAPTSGGGGGGGFTFNNSGTVGQVLGTSTGPTIPNVTASSCGVYLTEYMRYGKTNDPDQVSKLQLFLNEFDNSGLPITGFFGKLTLAAVDAFQIAQADFIRTPWANANVPISNSEWPTGYVYKTTLHRINQMVCSTLNVPVPPLP